MTVVFELPGLCTSLNKERAASRWERAALTKQWRHVAWAIARSKQVPPFTVPVIIVAQPFQSRGKLADAGNHLPSVKAAVDGLVDAGVLAGDDPRYVAALMLLAPIRGTDGLIVSVTTQTAMTEGTKH